MENLKKEIKQKSEEQSFYKNQRKTVNLIGERKISSDEAQWRHLANRCELRAMYLALGILKGKDLSTIDSNYEIVLSRAEKIAEKHERPKIVCSDR